MPGDVQKHRKSRREFLGAAAAGAASLTVTAVVEPTADAAEAGPSPSTVRDHLWLFTCPAGLNDDYLEMGNYRGGSRMTPAEGAFYLNIPNLLLIRGSDLPKPPSDEQWRAKTTFEQYAISFQPLDRVVWSVVGSGGLGGMKELDYVLPLAKKYPNINGIYLDDFIVGADISPTYSGDSAIGATKPANGPRVGRPALDRNELKLVRERLNSLGRPMDIWVTLYRHELLPKHSLHKACNPPLAGLARSVRRAHPVDFALPGACCNLKRVWRRWKPSAQKPPHRPGNVHLGLLGQQAGAAGVDAAPMRVGAGVAQRETGAGADLPVQ